MGNVNSSPLVGKRVVITRAALQSAKLVEQLTSRGAIPKLLPLVSFAGPEDYAPLDKSLAELEEFDWIVFTSANAVQHFCERWADLGHNQAEFGNVENVAVVGPVTAEGATAAGFLVDHIATTHSGVALAQELGGRVRDKKVLLPRSDRANPDLPAALKHYGALVTEVVAYRTLRPNSTDQRKVNEILGDGPDAILFFSPTAVNNFAELLATGQMRILADKIAMFASGPVTANALREANVERMIVAADITSAAAVDALEEYFAGKKNKYPQG